MSTDVPPTGGWTPGGLEPSAALNDAGLVDRWGPLRDFVRDRLPPALRGSRLDPGTRGALALAGVALLAAGVAVIVAWSSSSRPAPKPAAGGPGGGGPSPSPAGPAGGARGGGQ